MSVGVLGESIRVGKRLTPYLVWDDVFFTGMIRERAQFDMLHTPSIDCIHTFNPNDAQLLQSSMGLMAARVEDLREGWRVLTQAQANAHSIEKQPEPEPEPETGADKQAGANSNAQNIVPTPNHRHSPSLNNQSRPPTVAPASLLSRWENASYNIFLEFLDYVQKDPLGFLFGIDA